MHGLIVIFIFFFFVGGVSSSGFTPTRTPTRTPSKTPTRSITPTISKTSAPSISPTASPSPVWGCSGVCGIGAGCIGDICVCECDPACELFGDCCSDYKEVCVLEPYSILNKIRIPLSTNLSNVRNNNKNAIIGSSFKAFIPADSASISLIGSDEERMIVTVNNKTLNANLLEVAISSSVYNILVKWQGSLLFSQSIQSTSNNINNNTITNIMIVVFNPTCTDINLSDYEIWNSRDENVKFTQEILPANNFFVICNNRNLVYKNFSCNSSTTAIISLDIDRALTIVRNEIIIDSVIIRNGNYSRNSNVFAGNSSGDMSLQSEWSTVEISSSLSLMNCSDPNIVWNEWEISLTSVGIPSAIATNLRQTTDLDDRIGYITLNVGFTRAIYEELNGRQPAQQYKLYVTNTNSNSATLLASKSLNALGGTSGSIITVAFSFNQTYVGIGEKFVLVSSNICGDSDFYLIANISDVERKTVTSSAEQITTNLLFLNFIFILYFVFF